MIKIKDIPTLQKLAYTLVVLVLVVYILFLLKDIIVPFLFAGLLSFLLLPVVIFLEKHKFPRALAILIAIVIAFSLVGVFFYFSYTQIAQLESLIPLITEKGTLLIKNLENFAKVNFHVNQTEILEQSQKYFTELLKNIPNLISQTLGTTSNFLINFSLLPLYIFLFLSYRDFLKTFIFKLLSGTSKHKIEIVIDKINVVIRSYLTGLLLVILIIGGLNTTALLILDIEHAIFFGFFAAILVLIPYIGIAIGAALPVVVALITKDSYLYAAAVAASFGTIQFLEGNFITPYVVGSKVSINSLAAIIALLLFGNLWGVSGLVLALPLIAVLKVIFDASDSTKAWGFLLGDSDHADVGEIKAKRFFRI
jgi:predicted PurR-regulated permease PerM